VSQQAYPANAGILDPPGGCIGDVQNRNMDVRLNVVGHFVHGIGADDDEIRTALFKLFRRFGQYLCGIVPFPLMLQHFYVGEVNGIHDAFGRMKPAEFRFDGFVDDAVILDGGLPAHTAD